MFRPISTRLDRVRAILDAPNFLDPSKPSDFLQVTPEVGVVCGSTCGIHGPCLKQLKSTKAGPERHLKSCTGLQQQRLRSVAYNAE